jgi:hypothetical protein
MSKLNAGLDALGTAMLVSSLGGVGVAAVVVGLELSPPPHPAITAVATSRKANSGFFISELL